MIISAPDTYGARSLEQKVQILEDYCHRLRKELEYALVNLDENNINPYAKIKTAQIENLEVGRNVIMGPDAYISWEKVTDQPNIAGIALDKINNTYIDANGVWTPNVYAKNINTIYGKIETAQIEELIVGDNVTMGANATISWNKVDNKPEDFVYNAALMNTLADYVTNLNLSNTLDGYVTNSELTNALYAYITTGDLTDTLMNYITNGELNTILGEDYIITGKILANQVTAGTLTGFNIRTAPTGEARMELSGDGLISYSSEDLLNGISMGHVYGDFSNLEFYVYGNLRGYLEYTTGKLTLGTVAGADIILAPSGRAYVGDRNPYYEIATMGDLSDFAAESWVSGNFAYDSHDHDGEYIRPRTGQDIEINVTDNGIAIFVDGSGVGSIDFTR